MKTTKRGRLYSIENRIPMFSIKLKDYLECLIN